MTKKLARALTLAGLASVLTMTPITAFAQFLTADDLLTSAAARCMVQIDTPWGDVCLVPLPSWLT